MKKLVLVVSMIALVGLAVYPATQAEADDFQVLWAIDLPREVYFIGESVTFDVVAFASDQEIFLPGEIALITIRNATFTEMYAAWITTNQNGTAPTTWVIPLESAPENYTIILQPIIGDSYVKNFVSLFDQDIYWQKRVEYLEDEINRQYEYINYLFGSTKYLIHQVDVLKDQVFIAGAIMMITILISLWVAIPEWGRRGNAAKSETVSSKLAKLIGFTNTPKVLLTEQHEELAQLKTPKDRRPPRYGMEHYCQFCDPDKAEPMTKNAYEKHILSHYKRPMGIRAWRRERIYKDLLKGHYAIPDPRLPHEKMIAAENRRSELIESVMSATNELKAIESEKAKLIQDAKADKKKVKDERKAAKAEKKAKTAKRKDRLPVVNDLPTRNTVPQRKARRVKQLSGIPDAPLEESINKPSNKSAIDDLFEKLSTEKVN